MLITYMSFLMMELPLCNMGNDPPKYFLLDSNGEIMTKDGWDYIDTSVNGYCRARKNDIDYLISSFDGHVYPCMAFRKRQVN